MSESVQHRLQERVKELTALHRAAGLLQDLDHPLDAIMNSVVAIIPVAWQYPEIAVCRIRCGSQVWQTPGYRPTEWRQIEMFTLQDGRLVELDVVYLDERPPLDEGPFLTEERDLIRSLAELLRAHFHHRGDHEEIVSANERLERQVAQRTASLRRLASEVCLAEERERRRIAEDLHDHLGQGLALIKIRLQQLRGDAVLHGHDRSLDELVSLSDQAIRYTRGLTFELSPPMLYELGLGPALDWLGEQVGRKHGLRVRVSEGRREPLPDDVKVMFWKSARELLHNVVKHAGAQEVQIDLTIGDGRVRLTIRDDGCGFDAGSAGEGDGSRFGLFSIEERLVQLGGRMEIDTAPGRGTCVTMEAALDGGDR